jgi:hypothetical protein
MARMAPERLLTLTDGIVAMVPAPFRALLDRPATSPPTALRSACRRIVAATLVASISLVLLLAVLHLLNALPGDHHHEWLDADNDRSVWSWASVASEAAAAVLLGLLAATSIRPAALAFCAGVVMFLSLDDFIRVHEALGSTYSPFPHAARSLWPVFYLPLLGVLLVLLWRVAQGFGPVERALLRTGLLALVVAVGLESATPLLFAVGQGHGTAGYEVEVAVEEGLELGGWIWIAGGLAAGLVSRGGDLPTVTPDADD